MQKKIRNLERELDFERDHFSGIKKSYEKMRLKKKIKLEGSLYAALQENKSLKDGSTNHSQIHSYHPTSGSPRNEIRRE